MRRFVKGQGRYWLKSGRFRPYRLIGARPRIYRLGSFAFYKR